jgi:hypothetical protein
MQIYFSILLAQASSRYRSLESDTTRASFGEPIVAEQGRVSLFNCNWGNYPMPRKENFSSQGSWLTYATKARMAQF